QQGEGIVQLLLPRDAGEARTEGVRRRDGEGAGGGGAVAAAAGLVGGGGGAAGHAVPGLGETHHLPAAGDQLGDLDRRFVRLTAGGQQHHLRQLRHLLRQRFREIDDG